MYKGRKIVTQVAEDISREVITRADAVRRNKAAIVQSFVDSEKQPQPTCCSLEPHGFSVDARFPGKVKTAAVRDRIRPPRRTYGLDSEFESGYGLRIRTLDPDYFQTLTGTSSSKDTSVIKFS